MANFDGNSVKLELKELISLLAKDIAQEVADSLRVSHIDPLTARVESLERKVATATSRLQGSLDTLWKVAVAFYALAEIWLKFRLPGAH